MDDPPSYSADSTLLCWYSSVYGHIVPDSVEGFVGVDDNKDEDEVSSTFKRCRFKYIPKSTTEIAFDIDGGIWSETGYPWPEGTEEEAEASMDVEEKAVVHSAGTDSWMIMSESLDPFDGLNDEEAFQKAIKRDAFDGVDPEMWFTGLKFPLYKETDEYKNAQRARLS